jgi:hypothetical protein
MQLQRDINKGGLAIIVTRLTQHYNRQGVVPGNGRRSDANLDP